MTKVSERQFLGHPIGLFVLFSTELWERFSFYSMRAFFVLYLTQAVMISKQIANEIYGAYNGFVYAAPFFGGILADRLLGQRRSIVIGGFLMAAAQFSLAAHAMLLPEPAATQPAATQSAVAPIEDAGSAPRAALLFLALGLLAAGNGFFKPNISSIVGSLYEQGDPRRDGAFTIFYMGINIGAFAAGISGQIAQKWGWHLGFLLAGFGMLLGQLIFFLGSGTLKGKGLPPDPQAIGRSAWLGLPNALLVAVGVAVFIPVSAFLVSRPTYVQGLAVVVALPIVAYLVWESFRQPAVDRDRMLVILLLSFFSVLFWAFFEQQGASLNLFSDERVDRMVNLLNWQFEVTSSFLTASTNALFIVILAIPFAKLWVWLAKRQAEPSSPLKFSLGLLQLAAGYVVFYIGAVIAAKSGRCGLFIPLLGFFLFTTGELCLSPVGLSTITKLSPAKFVSTFMGVWFLATALGHVLGGYVGGKTERYGYQEVFFWITVSTVVCGVILLICVRKIKAMMHGVK